jgi:hypothetical protein
VIGSSTVSAIADDTVSTAFGLAPALAVFVPLYGVQSCALIRSIVLQPWIVAAAAIAAAVVIVSRCMALAPSVNDVRALQLPHHRREACCSRRARTKLERRREILRRSFSKGLQLLLVAWK